MFSTEFIVQLISLVIKILILIGIGATVAPIMTWLERRQFAFIQRRLGPNRVGFFKFRFFGLLQPLADAIKLLFKEDFIPPHTHKIFYFLAPVITSFMGLMALMCIPFGKYIVVFNEKIDLHVVSLNVGFLYLFAMSGLGIYGVVMAGWGSNNKYSLLGALRSSAQMISYELAMGLALVPLVLVYGSFDLQKIVEIQSQGMWGIFLAPISFCIFLVTMFAETNRLPFDLAEGEAELVAGFLVEYGAMRWSQFFLGEYVMMTALSGLAVCLFFGGYEIPFLPHETLVTFFSNILSTNIALVVVAIMHFITMLVKIALFLIFFVQVRFTVPRFRYDQLMNLGWKTLFPLALFNIFLTTAIWVFVKGFPIE